MKLLLILWFLLFACKTQRPHSGISVAGGKVSKGSVAVVPLLINSGGELKHCTGTIIKEHGEILLLTAAHCAYEKNDVVYIATRRDETLGYGAWKRKMLDKIRSNSLVEIEEIVVIPNTKVESEPIGGNPNAKKLEQWVIANDFALGRIPKRFYPDYENKAISIKYDLTPDELDAAAKAGRVRLIGAGSASGDGGRESNGIMRKATLNQANLKAEVVADNRIIELSPLNPRKVCSAACKGDSGSPLLYDKIIEKKRIMGINFDKKETYVIGVLSTGEDGKISRYASLMNNRFTSFVDIAQKLSCRL